MQDPHQFCPFQRLWCRCRRSQSRLCKESFLVSISQKELVLMTFPCRWYSGLPKLFANSSTKAVVPTDWRLAIICPIHKKGEPEDVTKCHPVGLTSIIRKIFKRILKRSSLSFLSETRATSPHRHGFLPRRSSPISPIDWTLISNSPTPPIPSAHHSLTVITSMCCPTPCSIYMWLLQARCGLLFTIINHYLNGMVLEA